ncbi:PREDICTED: uncharacterized protein LOC108367551 [Rhagoletis zephyria]|uniref:uncharacterized protein LOC108367551 n=1 Tax=Rhagoletis zephyria TaxID=28612 RepID=UPI0008117C71|nr:PREDICTED: uncharacterized protein LOC108367551 [Rhagoletis zephyria]
MLVYNKNHNVFYKHSIIFLFMSQLSSNSLPIAAQRIKSPAITSRNYRIVTTSLQCYHTIPDIVENFHCHQTERNNRTYSSGSLIFRRPINRLDTQIVLDIYRPNGNRMNVFNISAEFCGILTQKKYGLTFFDKLLKVLYATMNVVPTCPLMAHFNYTITDFDIVETILPAYILRTNFRSGIYFLSKGRRGVGVAVEGKVLKAN